MAGLLRTITGNITECEGLVYGINLILIKLA